MIAWIYNKVPHNCNTSKKGIFPLFPLKYTKLPEKAGGRSFETTCTGTALENYFLKKEDDTRLTGVFPIQQLKTLKKLVKRRCIGKPVSTKWIQNDFFITCKQDLPPGFDPSNTSQFGSKWCQNYKRRQGLSVRRRTNKKKTSVFERLHKIHGYHGYCQYDMAFAEISSEEEESSSEEAESSSEESSS